MIESTRSGYLRRALSQDGNVLVVAVDAREVVEELLLRQQLMPPSLIHVGQAALGALLLQSLSDPEENQRLEFRWSAQGPFGNLYAEVLGTGRVRSTVSYPQAEVDRLDEPLGDGVLQVRRFDSAGLPYSGIVTSSGRVGLDIVEYLERSEQKSCGMSLSVQVGARPDFVPPTEGAPTERILSPFYVKSAVGYLIHILPQSTEARHAELLRMWDGFMADLGPLSKWVLPEGPPEEVSREILNMLLPQEKWQSLYGGETRFSCNCSQERAMRALSLARQVERSAEERLREAGEAPPPSMAVELPDGTVEVTCEFCGTRYRLAAEGLGGPDDIN